MPRYLCSIPNIKGPGRIPELISDDPVAIAAFIEKWDREGRSVYECVATLKPGATRRSLETVEALHFIHVDIDLRSLVNRQDEVLKKISALPLPLEIHDSGGGYHVLALLKEAVVAGTPEFDHVNRLRRQLTHVLCGDPAPDHAAALLRVVGTRNFKYGEPRLCQVVQEGEAIDTTEVEELLDLLADNPLFKRPKTTIGDYDHADDCSDSNGHKPLIDIETELDNIAYQDDTHGFHQTELRVTAALLNRGVTVDMAVEEVLAGARKAAAKDDRCKDWDWEAEKLAILRMCLDWINKKPELFELLPDKLLIKWRENLAKGKTPNIWWTHYGPCIRGYDRQNDKDAGTHPADSNEGQKANGSDTNACKYQFKLVAFQDMRPGLEPVYLVDELIPSAGLVLIWGKQKTYKSFWVLDLMLHISLGWPYRDRAVRQGPVIYCAFEGAHGYKARIEALRRHYQIPDSQHVPLFVMPGQADLINDEKTLISDFRAQLGDIKPLIVVLDTLNRSLKGSESSDEDMTKYTRAAEAIRTAFGCVVIIVHHCGYDETHARGHTSLPAAVDAELSVVRSEGSPLFLVAVKNMRDGPEGTTVKCRAHVVPLDADQNGRSRSSIVVVPDDSPIDPSNRGGRPDSAYPTFLSALRLVLSSHGIQFCPDTKNAGASS